MRLDKIQAISQNQIFIDPSTTSSGLCCFFPKIKTFHLGLFPDKSPKKTLLGHYLSSQNQTRYVFPQFLTKLKSIHNIEPESVDFFLEFPFPGGITSASLTGLQYHYIDTIRKSQMFQSLYSMAPSYIKSQTKKRNDGLDSPKLRNDLAYSLLAELMDQGYQIHDFYLLRKPGCDVATAVLLWFYTHHPINEDDPTKPWDLLFSIRTDVAPGGTIPPSSCWSVNSSNSVTITGNELVCGECGKSCFHSHFYDFCPHCGARQYAPIWQNRIG